MNTTNTLPCLETERLILRPLTYEDTDFIFRHFSDPAVARYLMDEAPLTERRQAEAIIEFYQNPAGQDHNRWGITWKADGALIGTCGYHRWDRRNRRAEIGYDLTPAYWGQGITVEALRAMLRHGFETTDLNRIEALVYTENIGSIRVLEKLGFRQDGLLREFFCQGGQFYDHLFFSLLRREWMG